MLCLLFASPITIAVAEIIAWPDAKPLSVPKDWTLEQAQQAIVNAVIALAKHSMPGCTVDENGYGVKHLVIKWHVSEVQGYTVGMTKDYPKNPCTYTGPTGDGLMLDVYFSPNVALEQAVRPQILKKYGGVPWDTLLGPGLRLSGFKMQIAFNISYGPKTSEELRKNFSDPLFWLQWAVMMSNQPQPNPAAPPTQKMFSQLTPREIIEWFEMDNPAEIRKKLVWNGREKEDDRIYSGEAAAWFIWKTQKDKEAAALRESLADVLLKKIVTAGVSNKTKSLHDLGCNVYILGALGARKQLDEIIKMTIDQPEPYLDCCFTPVLMDAWATAAGSTGLLRICKMMDKGEPWMSMSQAALIKATGHTIPPKDGKPDAKAWLEYCEKLATKK